MRSLSIYLTPIHFSLLPCRSLLFQTLCISNIKHVKMNIPFLGRFRIIENRPLNPALNVQYK